MRMKRYAERTASRWQKGLFPVLFCLLLLLSACNIEITAGGSTLLASPTAVLSNGAQQGLQVFVEPDAGEGVITNAINGAHRSVWLELYLLTNRNVINALEEAANRGLDVRVMLETHPYGGGSLSPTETMDRLSAAGVKVKATSPAFALTHEKGMIIDGTTAYIMTCNLTNAALGVGSTKNREYGIIDTNPPDVKAVSDIFEADWNRTQVSLSNPNLVVSPINSRSVLESLIKGAQKSLLIEAEELIDDTIEQDLAAAAQRGVTVQVILPYQSSSSDSNHSGIMAIKRGGAQVREDKQLYMHAKLMIVDGEKAFVGSENFSSQSLDHNRELGIVLSDQHILSVLQQTFSKDWNSSRSV
ncbi:phospholipase D-like domain-containing protein [Thermogemmatispora tikiterensis]|nr:phospholipase D-like domain-containing protein [Thermogemmatispora tikiterensis]